MGERTPWPSKIWHLLLTQQRETSNHFFSSENSHNRVRYHPFNKPKIGPTNMCIGKMTGKHILWEYPTYKEQTKQIPIKTVWGYTQTVAYHHLLQKCPSQCLKIIKEHLKNNVFPALLVPVSDFFFPVYSVLNLCNSNMLVCMKHFEVCWECAYD